jgi:hypothetical protein
MRARQQRGQMKLLLLPAVALTAGTVIALTYLGKPDAPEVEAAPRSTPVSRAEQRMVQLKLEQEREAFLAAQKARLSPPKPEAPEPEVVPAPLPTRTTRKQRCKTGSWEKAANNPRLRKSKGPLILGDGPCEPDSGKISFIR